MIRYAHINGVEKPNLQLMSDEQLATADELIRETMTMFQAEGDRPKMMRLFAQHCAIIKESKDRSAMLYAQHVKNQRQDE